jgi:hypothetical protein
MFKLNNPQSRTFRPKWLMRIKTCGGTPHLPTRKLLRPGAGNLFPIAGDRPRSASAL